MLAHAKHRRVVEPLAFHGFAQALQCIDLNLPDALTRYPDLTTNFFQLPSEAIQASFYRI